MMTASVELARPFTASMPSLWGAVFVDAGNAGQFRQALKPAWARAWASAGAARWGRCGWTGPMASEERKSRMHFSVGIAF
jgi:translocation and assembly module TamA